MSKKHNISIPETLYKRLKVQKKNSSFKSVDDFAVFALQSYLDQQEGDQVVSDKTEDDKAVLKRLEDLGYM